MCSARVKFFSLFIIPVVYIVITNMPVAFAQETQSSDYAYAYQIDDDQAEPNDILSLVADRGLVRTDTAYDSKLFGVLQSSAQTLLIFRSAENEGQPVARNGIAQVNVTTIGGSIQPGDNITSSTISGKGQKANESGYIIGTALTKLAEGEGNQIEVNGQQLTSGKVQVAMRIEYSNTKLGLGASASIFSALGIALFKNVQDPDKFTQVMRYTAAGLSVLLSLFLAFNTFSKSIPKAIEAIGRNPLAEKAIRFSIILNIVLTAITASIGVFAALIIMRL